jgi:hypothetical protein
VLDGGVFSKTLSIVVKLCFSSISGVFSESQLEIFASLKPLPHVIVCYGICLVRLAVAPGCGLLEVEDVEGVGARPQRLFAGGKGPNGRLFYAGFSWLRWHFYDSKRQFPRISQ